MANVRLDVTARCQRCDWTGASYGAADRHTLATGHATATVAVPVKAAAP